MVMTIVPKCLCNGKNMKKKLYKLFGSNQIISIYEFIIDIDNNNNNKNNDDDDDIN